MADGGRPAGRSSFSRAVAGAPASSAGGVRVGPNGGSFVSSGIPDLDRILGGGFLLGSVVMVIEDSDAPHHLLLLRNFMAQGITLQQPLLFVSPLKEPRAFLGTLPSPVRSSRDEQRQQLVQGSVASENNEKNLRIAWQYKKYYGEEMAAHTDKKLEFGNEFDLRKPLERNLLNSQQIDCVSTQGAQNIADLRDRCSAFLSKISRNTSGTCPAGRVAVLSLCSPQCGYFEKDWEVISFIRSLRAKVRSSNAVAMITVPAAAALPRGFSKRWQHLADTLLSVKAIPDDDKELEKLLTGYQDMVGLLHLRKVAPINTQVPVILEASTVSIKLHKRRSLVLEKLNQAPVDAASGTSYASSGSCSTSTSTSSPLDF